MPAGRNFILKLSCTRFSDNNTVVPILGRCLNRRHVSRCPSGENLGGVRDAGTATYFDGSDGLGPDAGVVVEADTPGITGARDTGGRLGASVSS